MSFRGCVLKSDLGLHPYTRALQERGHDVHSLDKTCLSVLAAQVASKTQKAPKQTILRKFIKKKNSELNQTSAARLRKSLVVQ